MNISVVIPVFKPDKIIFDKIRAKLKEQKYLGKIETIIIEKGSGLSTHINLGIKKSKYVIVVVLHQDCIPTSSKWLKLLVAPFEDKNVVASVSRVEYPEELWNKLNYIVKGLMVKEKGVITSSLDGKAVAYRKSSLNNIGMYDENSFKTAGEDYDLYIKLKKIGKIAYPDASVYHYHPTGFAQRIRKVYQYSNGYGALTRIHWTNMILWYVGIIKAVPFFGLITYPLSYPWKKGGLAIFPAYLASSLIDHLYYIFGFWKGFIDGKQTVR